MGKVILNGALIQIYNADGEVYKVSVSVCKVLFLCTLILSYFIV